MNMSQYDKIDVIYNNIYRVYKNSLCGIINNSGEIIFPTIYKSILLLGDSLLRLELNNRFWLSTFDGTVITQEYIKIEYALNGKYAVFTDKWHFIDSFGSSTEMPDNVLLYTCSNGCHIDLERTITPPFTTYKSIFLQSPIYSECVNGHSIIIFKNRITQIGEKAFASCHNLLEICIPNSVELIDDFAFEFTSLKSITIPSNVKRIGRFAFYGCTEINNINIPASVSTINAYAFSRCSSLKKFSGKFSSDDGKCIIINDTLCAFAIGCGDTEYVIPSNVTSIGCEAFHNCRSLKNISIPDSVTRINESAFRGCSNLTSVTIPKNVTVIGSHAFAVCKKLQRVFFKSTNPPLADVWDYDWEAFLGNASGRILYVPQKSIEKYKSSYFWKKYSNDIYGYDTKD